MIKWRLAMNSADECAGGPTGEHRVTPERVVDELFAPNAERGALHDIGHRWPTSTPPSAASSPPTSTTSDSARAR